MPMYRKLFQSSEPFCQAFFIFPEYPWMSVGGESAPASRHSARTRNNWRLKLWWVWIFWFCYLWIKGHLRLKKKKKKRKEKDAFLTDVNLSFRDMSEKCWLLRKLSSLGEYALNSGKPHGIRGQESVKSGYHLYASFVVLGLRDSLQSSYFLKLFSSTWEMLGLGRSGQIAFCLMFWTKRMCVRMQNCENVISTNGLF